MIENQPNMARYFGGVCTRPLVWPSLLISCFAALTGEFVVAIVRFYQRRGESKLSLFQTFMRTAQPGMQSMLGNGKGYDSFAVNLPLDKPATTWKLVPCCSTDLTKPILIFVAMFTPWGFCVFSTMNSLMQEAGLNSSVAA